MTTSKKITSTTLLSSDNKKSSSALVRRQKFGSLLKSYQDQDSDNSGRNSSASHEMGHYNRLYNNNIILQQQEAVPENGNGEGSPAFMSPWNHPSPYTKSPWTQQYFPITNNNNDHSNVGDYNLGGGRRQVGLIGSIVREEGHIYSLAISGGFLYTGSDSKNIRVWKNMKEYAGFKSSSGLVKAIVILGEKIFTGHQDGKIRVWKFSKNGYKRVGSLPTTKDYLKSSINPKSYVEVRRKRNKPWIRHFDAVSCLSVDADRGLLYSGSWDKTLKVWRLSDSKCLESINAHTDALNSVTVGFDGLVFSGSADGTVKGWRTELVGTSTKHVPVGTLLEQENAVTSLATNAEDGVLYAGSSDGLINFWEREKNSISHGGVLRGHKLAVLCVSAAGNLVFSGSADKNICVWRREEGGIHVCLSVLTGHTGPVKCLAVEPDDDENDIVKGEQRWRVYSGSLDKSVKVWRVSENVAVLRKHDLN